MLINLLQDKWSAVCTYPPSNTTIHPSLQTIWILTLQLEMFSVFPLLLCRFQPTNPFVGHKMGQEMENRKWWPSSVYRPLHSTFTNSPSQNTIFCLWEIFGELNILISRCGCVSLLYCWSARALLSIFSCIIRKLFVLIYTELRKPFKIIALRVTFRTR